MLIVGTRTQHITQHRASRVRLAAAAQALEARAVLGRLHPLVIAGFLRGVPTCQARAHAVRARRSARENASETRAKTCETRSKRVRNVRESARKARETRAKNERNTCRA